MSRTEDIDNAIWDEADFYALNAPAKLIYIWSWTNRRCDFSGIYQVPLAAIASETKHDEQTVKDALLELDVAAFVFYDGTWLWVKARVKRIKTRTVQMCKAIVKDLAHVPSSHPYRLQLLELHGSRVWQSKDVRTTIKGELETLTGLSLDSPDTTRLPLGSHPAIGSAQGLEGSHPADTSESPMTGPRTGTGIPLGRGVGRESGDAPQPSIGAIKMRDEHFPGEDPAAIEAAAWLLRMRHEDVTPETIREALAEQQTEKAAA